MELEEWDMEVVGMEEVMVEATQREEEKEDLDRMIEWEVVEEEDMVEAAVWEWVMEKEDEVEE